MNPSIEFIKRNIGKWMKPEKLSLKAKELVNKIVSKILMGQDSWKINQTYREHRLTEFPKGDHFSHIVGEIREEIEKFSKIGKEYSFSIGRRTFTIYAIYPCSPGIRISPEKIYKMLDESVIKMYIWLYVVCAFIGEQSTCSPQLTVYWYLTKRSKNMPEMYGEVIDEINANTGFTMACPSVANAIYIYRREEWFKVFIHETIHSFGVDFAQMPEEKVNRAIFQMFGVHCDLRLYEAYTETWAEIINAIFVCMTPPPELVENALNNERMFSLFQKTKVLGHQRIKYRELCTASTSRTKYAERTPVFSYFIIKSILMFHYNDFIEWCVENNRGTFVFQKTDANVGGFIEFIRSHYQSPRYITANDHYDKWFSQNRHKKDIHMNSLRMSVSEK
jgi:hypothetical protein